VPFVDVSHMRGLFPTDDAPVTAGDFNCSDLPERWGPRHTERMGNATSSTFASPPEDQGRLQGRRRPPASARPAGQTAGLRRPARLPAGAAGRRLWHPPARHPPGHHRAAIRRAIADYHLPQPPRREQLARQRQRAALQRAAAQVAGLGFPSVRAYLVARLVTQAWTLAQVRGELGAAPSTLRRLLDRYQIRRVAPTRRQRAAAAAASGPKAQVWAVSRAARPGWPSSASPR
jgi:hypothetical protein